MRGFGPKRFQDRELSERVRIKKRLGSLYLPGFRFIGMASYDRAFKSSVLINQADRRNRGSGGGSSEEANNGGAGNSDVVATLRESYGYSTEEQDKSLVQSNYNAAFREGIYSSVLADPHLISEYQNIFAEFDVSLGLEYIDQALIDIISLVGSRGQTAFNKRMLGDLFPQQLAHSYYAQWAQVLCLGKMFLEGRVRTSLEAEIDLINGGDPYLCGPMLWLKWIVATQKSSTFQSSIQLNTSRSCASICSLVEAVYERMFHSGHSYTIQGLLNPGGQPVWDDDIARLNIDRLYSTNGKVLGKNSTLWLKINQFVLGPTEQFHLTRYNPQDWENEGSCIGERFKYGGQERILAYGTRHHVCELANVVFDVSLTINCPTFPFPLVDLISRPAIPYQANSQAQAKITQLLTGIKYTIYSRSTGFMYWAGGFDSNCRFKDFLFCTFYYADRDPALFGEKSTSPGEKLKRLMDIRRGTSGIRVTRVENTGTNGSADAEPEGETGVQSKPVTILRPEIVVNPEYNMAFSSSTEGDVLPDPEEISKLMPKMGYKKLDYAVISDDDLSQIVKLIYTHGPEIAKMLQEFQEESSTSDGKSKRNSMLQIAGSSLRAVLHLAPAVIGYVQGRGGRATRTVESAIKRKNLNIGPVRYLTIEEKERQDSQ